MSSLKSFKNTATGALGGAGVGFLVGGPAGAAIGAGVGGLAGYSTDAQNRANRKAVDRANAYDLYTWDLANQYNDPKAQMARLRAAGLNPNLVYGSGNVTGNTAGVADSNGVASQGVFNVTEKGLPFAQGLANLNNTYKQNELLDYQMGQTMAQTESIRANTRNLNNYLDGTGKSTYDPVLQKNIDGTIGKISEFGNTIAKKTSGYWNFLGDTAFKFKNLMSTGYDYWKGVYNDYFSK